jgi:hypothetical protein
MAKLFPGDIVLLQGGDPSDFVLRMTRRERARMMGKRRQPQDDIVYTLKVERGEV